MRQASVHVFALAALLTLAAAPPLYAEIEQGGAVKADACADDGRLLGVSRVVEVDTTGGSDIGGDRKGAAHFLNDGEVVLTFDDGPARANTRAILKALADQCTKATFFMVGQMALADPETVREVAAAGHTIGTHTWSHQNMRSVTSKAMDQQIESAISTVSKAEGAPIAPLFRFPYLSSSRQADAYLKGRNIGAVWVDVDSKDYLTRSPNVVRKRILQQLATAKKGIILMHDIHAWTAKMLPDLLADLHEQGFKVVHMVAKAPVETIASYDAAAEKALTAKAAAKAAQPVAQKSLVWTMTPPPAPKRRAWKHTKKVETKPSIIEGTSGTPPTSAKARASDKAKGETPLWQFNLFN
jgi:peptidoglycan/xylan/chitin deacetylase (PgdA/CDA1 family)